MPRHNTPAKRLAQIRAEVEALNAVLAQIRAEIETAVETGVGSTEQDRQAREDRQRTAVFGFIGAVEYLSSTRAGN